MPQLSTPEQLGFVRPVTRPVEKPAAIQAADGLCKLPSLRPVALKVLKLLSREDAKLAEIAGLLQSDPGFGAEVLTMANSAIYGALQPIGELSRAIVFLGLDRIRSLTMTIAMRSFTSKTQDAVEMRQSWRHSLACALLAEELAAVYEMSKHRAYTAGLLHDIGRLGLLKAYSSQYGALLNEDYETLDELHEKERKLFNMDHCQAGLWLSKTWGFPEEFSEIAARHHQCPDGRDRDMIGLVQTACRMSDALGFAAVRYSRAPSPEEIVREVPGQLQRRFPTKWDEVQARINGKLDSLA